MSSKYRLESSLIYIEGTDVPHNKLGISNSDELHELERELIEEAYQVFYSELDEATVFDIKFVGHRLNPRPRCE